ncbi:hypothetical protein LMH87_001295 [Akanthomyces muscarius]|uniref:Uncharacterized protein n=1 Tax=Akanthomyces muscarius TaxID=2231603 RepID=A0A9W8UPM1_AKAMU|nr:hypothetical protein LMH87_001295 [Akanthomyces muscarius]KAJ4156081.1 hypothetical protein LMH87_001295 [Akanthomyces muscarius]
MRGTLETAIVANVESYDATLDMLLTSDLPLACVILIWRPHCQRMRMQPLRYLLYESSFKTGIRRTRLVNFPSCGLQH